MHDTDISGSLCHAPDTNCPDSRPDLGILSTIKKSIVMSNTFQPGEGGGFLNPTLSSPAPSTATNAISHSTTTPSHLPRQRMHPLKSGGVKESSLINYVDGKILRINRRHAKKFSSVIEDQKDADGGDEDKDEEETKGYESFKEVAKDIEEVIDVVWVSGTRESFYNLPIRF